MTRTNEQDFEDKEITCACGNTFTFSAGEQLFFLDKGFTPPKRCKDCRARTKKEGNDKVFGICVECRLKKVLDKFTMLCERCTY